MDFLESAKILLPRTAGLSMTVCGEDEEELQEFENTFCFLPPFQPVYTAAGLKAFFGQQEQNRIYEITDALDTQVILINLEDRPVLLGPYVTSPWQETQARICLTKCGLRADVLLSYKVYRCKLPLRAQSTVEDIAFLILENMTAGANLQPVRINWAERKVEQPFARTPEIGGRLKQINRRYAWEFDLMDAVQQGNTEKAVGMISQVLSTSPDILFLTDRLNDKIANAFAARVLIRHAALKAGLTPFFVDALSQEYAQKMHRVADVNQLNELLRQYIIAFCHAIRENNKNRYSSYVKHAIQYIDLRLNQTITANELCVLDHLTQQYFAALFKKKPGKTVKQYIMQARCERAAELLKSSGLSIQQIGQYVGYEDANYFSRVFKTVIGLTPQAYRKKRNPQGTA